MRGMEVPLPGEYMEEFRSLQFKSNMFVWQERSAIMKVEMNLPGNIITAQRVRSLRRMKGRRGF